MRWTVPATSSHAIVGLVIAGGRSTRFGSEKAVAEFAGGPMMDRAIRALGHVDRLAVSARAGSGAERRAQEIGADVLRDSGDLPEGPLRGLLSGLRWAARMDATHLATVPCDAPLLPDGLVERLETAIGNAMAAYAVTARGEHPLCALWRTELRAPLSAQLQRGEHPAVRAFLRDCGAVGVEFDNASAFANANTVEALSALEWDA